jgi:hypothetical protein
MDTSVSLPAGWLLSIGLKFMPPIVSFGSPVQRSKSESESWWHVPISIRPKFKIGPNQIPGCRVYVQLFDGDRLRGEFKMHWGDTHFETPKEAVTLVAGETVLVPITWRTENNDDRNAYLTDAEYFTSGHPKRVCPPDRAKRKFKLVLKSGTRRFESPHAYLIRVPGSRSNGNFLLEVEYEGSGSAPEPIQEISSPA